MVHFSSSRAARVVSLVVLPTGGVARMDQRCQASPPCLSCRSPTGEPKLGDFSTFIQLHITTILPSD